MKDALRRSEGRFRRTALLGIAFGERCLNLMGKNIHGNEVSKLMESFIERLAVKQRERREKEKENKEKEGKEKGEVRGSSIVLSPTPLAQGGGLSPLAVIKPGIKKKKKDEEEGEELLQTIEVYIFI
jgi:hypothetical protein